MVGRLAGAAKENRPAPRGAACFDVARLVANHPTCFKIDPKVTGSLKKHAWLRLPPRVLSAKCFDGAVGVIGTEVKGVDQGVTARSGGDHPPEGIVDSFNIGRGIEASSNSSLIRDDHQPEARIVEARSGRGRAVKQNERRRIPEVAVVGDQGVVSIKEYGRGHVDGEDTPARRGVYAACPWRC